MRVLVTLIVALFVASPVFAQSTDCNDLTPPSVSTKNPPAEYRVCWSGKDDQGVAYAAADVTAWKVFVNGVLVKTVANPLSVAETANASGLRLFKTPGTGALAIPKGSDVVTYTFVTSDGESEASAGYTFQVRGTPARPVGGRVVGS
jgi:hypothetical protein